MYNEQRFSHSKRQELSARNVMHNYIIFPVKITGNAWAIPFTRSLARSLSRFVRRALATRLHVRNTFTEE